MRLRLSRGWPSLSLPLPVGAWDCHAHVIGPAGRFPLAAGRDYDPRPASLEAYLTFLERNGLERGVLVQPSVYGFDNRCLLDALQRSDGRVLGIAVPHPETATAELEAMHRHGVRGVRCNLLLSGGLSPEVVTAWRPVLHDLGWHVELHVAVDRLEDLRALAERLGVPVVVDHLGRPAAAGLDPGAAASRQLIDLARDGAVYVKLSAPYRSSRSAPPWSDVAPLARALLAARPEGCLWGSDWPHTQMNGTIEPGPLFEALDAWCPDPDVRRVILSEAPSRLFPA